jgi:PAS domain S-box-containing protein
METEKYSKDKPDVGLTTELSADKIHITYADYKALEQGYIEERKKMEDRIWLDTQVSRFDDVLRDNYDTSVTKFSENVINYMARLTGAVHGAFFVVDNDSGVVIATAGYATTVETMDRNRFKLGEGLIGQVGKTKEMLCLDDVETQVDSSLGRINASFLIITPLVFNNTVYGVIEITTLSKLKPRYLILIERVSRNIAAALQSLITNQKTKQLLIESLQQYEDFKQQTEELSRKEQELQTVKEALKIKEDELNTVLNQTQKVVATDVDQAASTKFQQEVTELNKLLNQKEEELKYLLAKLEQYQSTQFSPEENLVQSQEFKQQAEELAQTKDFLKEIQWQLTQKEDELNENKGKVKELEVKLAQNSSQAEQVIVEVPVGEAAEELLQLRADLTEAQNNLKAREAEVEELIKKVYELATNNQDVVEYKGQLDALSISLKEKDQEIEKLKALLANAAAAVETQPMADTINVEEWQTQINALTEQLKVKEIELKEAVDKINEELSSKLEIAGRLEVTESELNRKSNEVHVLKETLKWKDDEIERLDHDIAERKREVRRLQEEIENQKNEIKNLNERLSENTIPEGWHSENEQLKVEIQAKSDNISRLQVEIEKLKQDFVTQQGDFQQKQLDWAIVESDLQQLQSEVNTLRESLKEAENAIKAKDQEIESLQAKIRKKEDELMVSQYLLNQMQSNPVASQEVTRLQNIIQEKEAEIQQLKVAQTTPVIDNDLLEQLKQQLAEKDSEINQLKEEQTKPLIDNDLLDQLKQQLNEKDNQIEVLKNKEKETDNIDAVNVLEINRLQNILQQKEAELESLKSNNESIVNGQIPDWVSQLQQQLERKEAELSNLKDEFQNQTTQAQEISTLIADLRQKEEQLEKYVEESNLLKHELEVKEQEISLLKQKAEVGSLVGDEDSQKLLAKIAELEQIQQELAEKKAQILQQAEWIDAQRQSLVQDQETLVNLKEEIKQKDQDSTKLQEKLMSLQHQLEIRETEMRQKERELTELFNKINNAFGAMEFDMNGNILSVNNKLLISLGMAEDEILNKSYQSFLAPEFVVSSKYKVLVEGLKLGVTQAEESIIFIGGKGRKLKMECTFIPILGEDGTPYEIVKLVGHISNLENDSQVPENQATTVKEVSNEQSGNQSGEELSIEAREKLRAVDNSFIINELDLDGKILDVNRQFLVFLGYEREEVVGKYHSDFLDVSDKNSEEYVEILNNFRNGSFASQVIKYVGKEGEIVRLRSYFNSIKDEAENPIKVLVLSQFIN